MIGHKPLLVVICGPTSCGKTDIAYDLAKRLHTEIINFDSVQVFKDVPIGSSQPPPFMLDEVKHHLISEISPQDQFTAGDFRKCALEIIEGPLSPKKVVVLVGGTGFYLQALLKGMYDMAPVDEKIKTQLKEELDNKGIKSLFNDLTKFDPEYACKIQPTDSYRILRALEVWRGLGRKLSQIQSEFKAHAPLFPVLQIGISKERSVLKNDILERTNQMIERGLVGETQSLIERYSPQIKLLQSVGYKESVLFIKGHLKSKDDLKLAITQSTIGLAKRQMTWFKRDASHWEDASSGRDKIINQICEFIKQQPIVQS